MSFSFRRITVFYIGTIIILIACYTPRIQFYLHGKIVPGKVTHNITWSGRRTTYSASVVKFVAGDYQYTIHGETNVHFNQNDIVSVIYNPDDPADAKILSFLGFWFVPMLYSILPFIIMAAAVFSFMSSEDRLTIGPKKQRS